MRLSLLAPAALLTVIARGSSQPQPSTSAAPANPATAASATAPSATPAKSASATATSTPPAASAQPSSAPEIDKTGNVCDQPGPVDIEASPKTRGAAKVYFRSLGGG